MVVCLGVGGLIVQFFVVFCKVFYKNPDLLHKLD